MKTILVVDDVADNIKLLKDLLSSENYNVKVANNGPRAIEITKKNKPDLILLDVMMPDMDGYEVCSILKDDPTTSNIPIIFITAKGDTEDETHGFEVGAVDYISKPISPSIVLARVKTHLTLTKLDSYNLLATNAIEMLAKAGHYNDSDTGCHVWRMAAYAKAIALGLGWSKDDADLLELAASMHDTGKIGISDLILNAPRKLTTDEWLIMQEHPNIGFEILSKSNHPVFQLSSIIAKRHHEKYDGSGYPDGLAGEEIPEAARIVAIADVFDALTMKRAYKEAWSFEEATNELQTEAGKHFDPKILNTFFTIIEQIKSIKAQWDLKEDESL